LIFLLLLVLGLRGKEAGQSGRAGGVRWWRTAYGEEAGARAID